MTSQSAPTPNPDDLDASLERMVDDALADPESALAQAPAPATSGGAGVDPVASRAEADKGMGEIAREMQQRVRDEAVASSSDASEAEKISPEQVASLDEALADAAPALDIDGDFESVDAAIGQIFDTRASVVQRAGKPAEVRDFPETARSRKSGSGPVKFQKSVALDDEDEPEDFEPKAPPSRAAEVKTEGAEDKPVEGVFEDVEVATAPQAVVASDERFSAFEALPLHHEESERPGPLKKAMIIVNKPLEGLAAQWRAAVGIAAVMTLFNAACLWAWLILR